MSVYDFVHVAPIGEGFQVAQGIWDEEAGGYRVTLDLLTGCQDRGCLIDPPKQGTNGGCRCLKYLPIRLQIEAKRRIRHMKGLAWASAKTVVRCMVCGRIMGPDDLGPDCCDCSWKEVDLG